MSRADGCDCRRPGFTHLSGDLGCISARPAAPAAEAGDELRARAERIVANWRVNFDHDDDRPLVNMIEAALVAEAAEAARLRAAVGRVREVAHQYNRIAMRGDLTDSHRNTCATAATRIRQALDDDRG